MKVPNSVSLMVALLDSKKVDTTVGRMADRMVPRKVEQKVSY